MNRIFGTLLLILLGSCTNITNPTLEGIEDVQINEVSIKMLDINVNALFNNPNPFALDLSSADIKILVDEIELGHVQQTFDASMPANARFKMPLNFKMDLNPLYNGDPLSAVTKGMNILKEKQLLVQLQGNIKVGKGGAKITVPVDQEELVKF